MLGYLQEKVLNTNKRRREEKRDMKRVSGVLRNILSELEKFVLLCTILPEFIFWFILGDLSCSMQSNYFKWVMHEVTDGEE